MLSKQLHHRRMPLPLQYHVLPLDVSFDVFSIFCVHLYCQRFYLFHQMFMQSRIKSKIIMPFCRYGVLTDNSVILPEMAATTTIMWPNLFSSWVYFDPITPGSPKTAMLL